MPGQPVRRVSEVRFGKNHAITLLQAQERMIVSLHAFWTGFWYNIACIWSPGCTITLSSGPGRAITKSDLTKYQESQLRKHHGVVRCGTVCEDDLGSYILMYDFFCRFLFFPASICQVWLMPKVRSCCSYQIVLLWPPWPSLNKQTDKFQAPCILSTSMKYRVAKTSTIPMGTGQTVVNSPQFPKRLWWPALCHLSLAGEPLSEVRFGEKTGRLCYHAVSELNSYMLLPAPGHKILLLCGPGRAITKSDLTDCVWGGGGTKSRLLLSQNHWATFSKSVYADSILYPPHLWKITWHSPFSSRTLELNWSVHLPFCTLCPLLKE